jgi:hypothetical protein
MAGSELLDSLNDNWLVLVLKHGRNCGLITETKNHVETGIDVRILVRHGSGCVPEPFDLPMLIVRLLDGAHSPFLLKGVEAVNVRIPTTSR